MSPLRLVLSVGLLASVVYAQNLGQNVAPNKIAQRSPELTSLLTKAVDAVGGVPIIKRIHEFTASGTITFNQGKQDATGTVTFKARGGSQFRMDASLPNGMRSWIANNGTVTQKTEHGLVSPVSQFSLRSPTTLVLPYLDLADALNGRSLDADYRGLSQVDGQNVHYIRLRRVSQQKDGTPQVSEAGMSEIFIDSSSFFVMAVRDHAFETSASSNVPTHEMRFRDFRLVDGIWAPFSIREIVGGQETWSVQLHSIFVNSGISDSDFNF